MMTMTIQVGRKGTVRFDDYIAVINDKVKKV